MGLHFGNKQVKGLYLGDKKVAKVYYGNKEVWGNQITNTFELRPTYSTSNETITDQVKEDLTFYIEKSGMYYQLHFSSENQCYTCELPDIAEEDTLILYYTFPEKKIDSYSCDLKSNGIECSTYNATDTNEKVEFGQIKYEIDEAQADQKEIYYSDIQIDIYAHYIIHNETGYENQVLSGTTGGRSLIEEQNQINITLGDIPDNILISQGSKVLAMGDGKELTIGLEPSLSKAVLYLNYVMTLIDNEHGSEVQYGDPSIWCQTSRDDIISNISFDFGPSHQISIIYTKWFYINLFYSDFDVELFYSYAYNPNEQHKDTIDSLGVATAEQYVSCQSHRIEFSSTHLISDFIDATNLYSISATPLEFSPMETYLSAASCGLNRNNIDGNWVNQYTAFQLGKYDKDKNTIVGLDSGNKWYIVKNNYEYATNNYILMSDTEQGLKTLREEIGKSQYILVPVQE